MLQLVLVIEFSLSDLALNHTKTLATTDVFVKPPDAGMNCLVEIVFSLSVVIFDTETHLTTSSPAVCILVCSMNYGSY